MHTFTGSDFRVCFPSLVILTGCTSKLYHMPICTRGKRLPSIKYQKGIRLARNWGRSQKTPNSRAAIISKGGRGEGGCSNLGWGYLPLQFKLLVRNNKLSVFTASSLYPGDCILKPPPLSPCLAIVRLQFTTACILLQGCEEMQPHYSAHFTCSSRQSGSCLCKNRSYLTCRTERLMSLVTITELQCPTLTDTLVVKRFNYFL